MVHTSIRVTYAAAGISSLAIFAMLMTSLFSSNWVGCIALRDVEGQPTDPVNVPEEKYTGYIRFGVIWGYKQFNYGYGARDVKKFVVHKEYQDDDNQDDYVVFNTDFIIVTMAFLIPAIVFSGVSAWFCLVNAHHVPIETITGWRGLCLWNSLGLVSGFVALGVFLGVYIGEIQDNAVSIVDQQQPYGYITHRVDLIYCFWLFVTSLALFVVNLLLIRLALVFKHPPEWMQKRYRTADVAQPSAIELEKAKAY